MAGAMRRGKQSDGDTRNALRRMEKNWDSRACEAPEYYIASARREWPKDEFFQSGADNVTNEILGDAGTICRDKKLGEMRVLEIGCGAGRMTRAMAAVFGEVHAVDISSEMIALAKRNLSDLRNVSVYKNNGIDLAGLKDGSYDFAFSFIVFQHIPRLAIIENYLREVHRCLKPNAVFKFQVQGNTTIESVKDDTWVGAPIGCDEAKSLAKRCGFELLRSSGEGTQYFWLWFLKRRWRWLPEAVRRFAEPEKIRRYTEELLPRLRRRVGVSFSPQCIRPGESYSVRIRGFAGQVIDIAYELAPQRHPAPVLGEVLGWCELNSRGEARLVAPSEQPAGTIRIIKIRSQTKKGRWHDAGGAIQVKAAED
jgi:ubiquinone/menaquinone biosynthesis C-methylase UbiE